MKDLCKDEERCYKIFFPDSIFTEYGSVDLISTKILISNSWTKIIAMDFWKSLDILDLKYHFIIHFYLNGNDKFLQLLIRCPWSVIKFLLYSLKYLIFAWNKRPVCIFLPSFPQLVYIVVSTKPAFLSPSRVPNIIVTFSYWLKYADERLRQFEDSK